jgi:hypothetical protein
MIKRSLLVLMVFLFGTGEAYSQGVTKNVSKSGTTAATFLEIPVSARAVALGSAFSAIANDASSLYWNPAGAARLEQTQVVFTHMNWIADLGFDYTAVVIPAGSMGTVGISFTALTMSDMAVRTIEKPDGTGELFSASSIAIGLHYAKNLSDRFSIGFTGKYIQESIWHMNSTAFALDIGVLYTTEFFNNMKIGATISNFGTDMQMTGRDARLFVAIDEQKMGSNQTIPVNLEMDHWSLPLNFQFGVATDLYSSEEQTLTVAVDALHPSDNYESINLGFEYGFYKTLALRGGYRALGLSDSEGGLTFGAGFNGELFGGGIFAGLDYAYSDYGRLKSSNVISLAITF